MIFILVAVCALAAAANAGGLIAPAGLYGGYGAYGNPYSNYPAQPAYATQQSNILRSPYNLGQVSTFSKTVNTPYSSVSKSDVRVSNPGVAIAPTYHGYAAPAYHGYAAPAYHGVAPAWGGYSAPVVSHVGVAPVAKVATAGLLGVAYSAAPTVSHMTYSNGLGLTYAW